MFMLKLIILTYSKSKLTPCNSNTLSCVATFGNTEVSVQVNCLNSPATCCDDGGPHIFIVCVFSEARPNISSKMPKGNGALLRSILCQKR